MPDLAAALADTPQPAQLRAGVVKALAGSQVTVDLGGGQLVAMPALTQYEAILGDVVQVLQQGAVQLVLGRTTAMSGANVLTNPSFEIGDPGSSGAYSWTVVPAVGTTALTVTTETATDWGAADGAQWLQVYSGTTDGDGRVYIVSEAIPVTAGQAWTAAAHVTAAGNQSNQVSLTIAWFADGDSMYPDGVVSEEGIQFALFPFGGYPRWLPLRALSGTGSYVPEGASHARVVITAEIFDIGWVYIDAIVARKVSD